MQLQLLFCNNPCVPFKSSRVLFVSRCKIRAGILRVKMAERAITQTRITNVNVPKTQAAIIVNVCNFYLYPNLLVLYIGVRMLLV